MRLQELREEVCAVNQALPREGLVTMHSGNASGFDPDSGLVATKPSGVDYATLRPVDLPLISLETGQVVEGRMRPSVDLPHHLYLYRHLEGVRGVIHTHSGHATAFAALGRPIPPVLTAIADEFGGEIPCAPFTTNDDESIGRAVVSCRGRGPACLLERHGIFAWGPSPSSALKAAVMTEDVARTVLLSLGLASSLGVEGPPPLNPDEIERWWARYHERYGQA